MPRIFYDELKEDKNYRNKLDNFSTDKIVNFEFINKNLKWKLRDYQEKGLYMMQYFMGLSSDDYFKNKITERINEHEISFYSFEMATGAGKTLLMGANILYLFKKGYKNFLIITPNTPIYEKTIRNFTVEDRRCLFSDETSLKFNLVTGDTYKDKTCNFEESSDINIFVFNIQKFFERGSEEQDESRGLAYTHRPLEESYWKDEHDNTISFVEYLRKNKLVIITDEAHHYQTTKSAEVIKELLPELIFEYTATALESSSARREQKVIFKYSIKQLIKDKYAKKVRALGYSGLEEKPTNQVTDADKRKIILSLLCHLVKKEVLKDFKQKPIMLIRTRQVEHSINVLNYIQNELIQDEQTINEVLEISKNEKAPVTKLFWEYYNNIKFNKEKLLKEISQICINSFRIDSENKNDAEIIEQWDTIEDNKFEIVVYVRMLDEGIDINNIFLITILSDSDNSITTNVRQAIGRGVRLFKEKREYDDVADALKKQSENLYIICDKNRKFETFIETIRKEMELSKDELGFDIEETEIEDAPDLSKLKDKEISTLELKYKEKYSEENNVNTILDKAELVIPHFIEQICNDINGKNIIKLELEAMLDERDIVAQEFQQTLSEHIIEERQLNLNEREIELLMSNFIEETDCIPDHEISRIKIRWLIQKILDKKIYFKSKLGYDINIPKNIFFRNFELFFSHYLWESLFEVEYRTKKKKLIDIYKTRKIMLEQNSYKNYMDYDTFHSEHDESSIDEESIYFTGFNYSIYKYNKFDSPQEKIIAVILDKIMEKANNNDNFWIKNGRKIEFTVRGLKHDFNPDFIIFFENQFYVLEVKGTGIFLNEFINRGGKDALTKLEEKTNDIKTCLLLSTIINNKIAGRVTNFESLMEYNSLRKNKLILEF